MEETKLQCGKDFFKEKYNEFLFYKCFTDSGIVAIIFGILTAILVSNGEYIEGKYQVNMSCKGVVKFKRLVVYLLVMLICSGGPYLISVIDVSNDTNI